MFRIVLVLLVLALLVFFLLSAVLLPRRIGSMRRSALVRRPTLQQIMTEPSRPGRMDQSSAPAARS